MTQSTSDDAVVVVRQRRSPMLFALAMATLVVIAAAFFVMKRRSDDGRRVASAGDVDTTLVANGGTSPMEAPPPPLPRGNLPPASIEPPTPVTPNPYPPPGAPPLVVVPGATPPPVVTPPIDTMSRIRDSLMTAVAGSSDQRCMSEDQRDQRACFNAALERNDVELNRVWRELIATMRSRANVAEGDPDPDNVRELRAIERRWVETRDAECRRRGEGREGAQWALTRAQCFAEFSAQRTRELMQMRDSGN